MDWLPTLDSFDLLVHKQALGSHCYKMRHNTSLVVSNMVGPSQPITFEKNLITKIGVTLSGLPAVSL